MYLLTYLLTYVWLFVCPPLLMFLSLCLSTPNDLDIVVVVVV